MSDLISRSALINALKIDRACIYSHVFSHVDCESEDELFIDLQQLINNQPTIEAEPVVYGEWIYENYTWHCGVCGFHPFKGYIPKEPGFNFCPNCMADMRKGGAE